MTSREQVELKACPFCGSNAEIRREWGGAKWFYPTCTGGDCPGIVEEQDEQGGTCCSFKSEAEAIAAWNTRAALPLDDEVVRLKHDLERQMTIANTECNEAVRLRGVLLDIRSRCQSNATAIECVVADKIDAALNREID